MEESFWDDVLQQRIIADKDIITKEIENRRLDIDPDEKYRLFIIASGNPEQSMEDLGEQSVGLYEKRLTDFITGREWNTIPKSCIRK